MDVTRRELIKGLAASALIAALPSTASAAFPKLPARSLKLENLHTGEKLAVTYWKNGKYRKDALAAVDHVLRDHRTGAVAPIDPRLLDLLHRLHGKLETGQPFQVISGFRSPASNQMLIEQSRGVAPRSLHLEGKAIDLRVPGRELASLRNLAIRLKGGGVGYYPASGFVHLDTGHVRYW